MGAAHKHCQNKNWKDYQRVIQWSKPITERIAAPHKKPARDYKHGASSKYVCNLLKTLLHISVECWMFTSVTSIFQQKQLTCPLDCATPASSVHCS